METSAERGFRRTIIGVVVSDKANKTITVEVVRQVKHPRYKKYIKKKSKHHAHDEMNQCKKGDKVVLIESKPISKLKRWKLKQIIESREI